MSKQLIARLEAFADDLDDEIANSDRIHSQQLQAGKFREIEAKSTAALRRGQDLKPQVEEETAYRFGLPEFIATSRLYLPENPDDRGGRPLGARSVGRPGPIEVSLDRRPVNFVDASTTYDVAVTIKNGGDMYVPSGVCELFRHPDKKKPAVEFETDDLRFLFRNALLTGTLKRGVISYGDHVRWLHEGVEYFMRVVGIIILPEPTTTSPKAGSSATNHTTLLEHGHTRYTLWLSVGDLRPGMKTLQNAVGTLHDAPDYHRHERMFRMRIRDVFRISGRGTALTGITEQGSAPTDSAAFKIFTNKIPGQRRRSNINTATGIFEGDDQTGGVVFADKDWQFLQRGDLVTTVDPVDFTPTKRAIPLPDRDHETPVFLKQRPFSINGHDSKTLHFQITTGPAASDEWNQDDYRFTARVYSVHPVDLPGDAEEFDPVAERRVGDVVLGK